MDNELWIEISVLDDEGRWEFLGEYEWDEVFSVTRRHAEREGVSRDVEGNAVFRLHPNFPISAIELKYNAIGHMTTEAIQ